jgi:hypothetical protein
MIADYSRYLSEILKYEKVQLGAAERSFLSKIVNTPESIYKIGFSSFRLKGRRSSLDKEEDSNSVRKLQNINFIEEVEEEKFLRGATHYYKLTTPGLFHVFSNMRNYPPQLFIRYQDDIVLKTLVYAYFEVETIKRSTARLYATITEYIHKSCESSRDAVENIRSITDEDTKYRYSKALEFDLNWFAKSLGFRLAVMYNESNILTTNIDIVDDNAKVALYEVENKMKKLLAYDDRFMKLLQSVREEFEDGYNELIKMKSEI